MLTKTGVCGQNCGNSSNYKLFVEIFSGIMKNDDGLISGRSCSMDAMTDKQFDKIIQMFEMILDGCKDLDDAKRKVKELREDKKEKAE